MNQRIITLLTDFGAQDYFVGAMKGVILSVNRQAKIVDVSHEIAPQDIRSGAFMLLNYYKTFPSQTIHICVVDPGVGSKRRAILVETDNEFFIAPDNGLLSFIFENEKAFRVYEITNEKFFRLPVSRTFHGRDVFAPVAAHLSGGISVKEFGEEITDFVRFNISAPCGVSDTEIKGEIIYVDHFGNLITNLKPENLSENFRLRINEQSVQKHQTFYSQASDGEIFSIFGSAGFLEIAAFRDSAKRLLNAKIGDEILVTKR